MWLFDFFKKWDFVRRAPTAQMQNLPKPTRPAPPMPRVRPSRQEQIEITTINDISPIYADWHSREHSVPSDEQASSTSSFAGAGGTFDGGGASGDWSDRRGCSAPDTSSSSDSSYSDSGSSCDSGSSGSFD